MADLRRAWLCRLLKLPPAPPLSTGEVRTFRAAPPYLLYRRLRWALGQAGVLAGLVAGAVGLHHLLPRLEFPLADELAWGLEGLAWLGFLVQLPFSFLVTRLDYEQRWYLLSDRSLRIREGVLSLREKTMTFANIQQLSIRQDPLQRLLGIADVKVESAGGGGSGSPEDSHSSLGERLHEAHFRGVSNAEEIRDVILACVRLHRDAGLGEPVAEDALEPARAPAPALEAAKELLSETRALRHALEHPKGR